MVAPQFEVDPKKELRKALRNAARQVDNLTIPLKLISQEWFKSNRAIFSLKGHGKYVDLKELTKKYKQREVGFVYPILRRSHQLEQSITEPETPEAISQIINKKDLVLGTRTPYAHFHQEGTKYLPIRPMVLFGNEQVAPEALKTRIGIWQERLVDYVRQVTEEAK